MTNPCLTRFLLVHVDGEVPPGHGGNGIHVAIVDVLTIALIVEFLGFPENPLLVSIIPAETWQHRLQPLQGHEARIDGIQDLACMFTATPPWQTNPIFATSGVKPDRL